MFIFIFIFFSVDTNTIYALDVIFSNIFWCNF